MSSIGQLLANYTADLATAGIKSARLDAQLLLAFATDQSRTALLLHRDQGVTDAQRARADALIARRLGHEPVAYLVGEQEFWSLPFAVTPDVLIPRADSETLVEEALRLTDRSASGRVLDLGTGSGCLLLATLSERAAMTGLGIDRSAAALAVARGNAAGLGLAGRAAFAAGNWAEGLAERFDLILCNPPYIGEGERDSLMVDVRGFEPHGALFAGEDGLAAYRRIIPALPALMNASAPALLEIGHRQQQAVKALAETAGLQARCVCDLGGRDRVMVLTRP